MRMIAAHSGKIQVLETAGGAGLKASPARAFTTGLAALDALAPQQSWSRGAVHELLFEPGPRGQGGHGQPKFIAAQIARAATLGEEGEGEKARRHEGTKARSEGQGSEGTVNSLIPDPSSPTSCLRAFVPSCLSSPIVWSDPHNELYPPALAALGFDLANLYLLRPASPADEVWAVS